ncbi:MAG: response regulator transcription factor [Chitinophagaceae bacterium]
MKNLLLVEDDPEITKLLELHLQSDLFRLTSCNNGKDAIDKILNNNFNLIILDIMLPDLSGMEVCKYLRNQYCNAPIMILTSRSDESDKVLALELGADDYVTKPFSILELIARTKALLRRADQNMPHSIEENIEKKIIVCKNITIDKNKRKASLRNERLELTPKEFDLLYLLANNPGKSFSRPELLKLIWGISFEGYEHTVTAHINRLRIKIEPDLNQPEYILTSWGIGYRFRE